MKKTNARKPAKKAPRCQSRSEAQKAADESALHAFEKNEFLAVPEAERAAAIVRLRKRREAREEAKRVAKGLGVLRHSIGVTQERLAKAIGVDKSDISRAESGRHVPSLERVLVTVKAMEQIAGMSIVSWGDLVLDPIYAAMGEPESFLDSSPLEEVST